MQIISSYLLLGSILLTATASPVELGLYERDIFERQLIERRITAKCALCISQCIGYVALCAVACGPGEVLGPLGCAVGSLFERLETRLGTRFTDRHGGVSELPRDCRRLAAVLPVRGEV